MFLLDITLLILYIVLLPSGNPIKSHEGFLSLEPIALSSRLNVLIISPPDWVDAQKIYMLMLLLFRSLLSAGPRRYYNAIILLEPDVVSGTAGINTYCIKVV